MAEHFDKVKGYLLDLRLATAENAAEELVVVDDEENGHQEAVHRLRAAHRHPRAVDRPRAEESPGTSSCGCYR